jgi:hypothetical protein
VRLLTSRSGVRASLGAFRRRKCARWSGVCVSVSVRSRFAARGDVVVWRPRPRPRVGRHCPHRRAQVRFFHAYLCRLGGSVESWFILPPQDGSGVVCGAVCRHKRLTVWTKGCAVHDVCLDSFPPSKLQAYPFCFALLACARGCMVVALEKDWQKLTAPRGLPRQSPTLVLTGPCAA